jgi:hypothetical protein
VNQIDERLHIDIHLPSFSQEHIDPLGENLRLFPARQG